MRLIDADKLIKSFKDFENDEASQELYGKGTLSLVLGDCVIDVEKQPTAFDLESVVKQLKELKTYKLNMADAMSELMNKGKLGNYVCLEDVIEILKSAANATDGKNGG